MSTNTETIVIPAKNEAREIHNKADRDIAVVVMGFFVAMLVVMAVGQFLSGH